MSSANSPLGIPIPKYMSALPRPQPPVRRGTVNDIQALDIIRNFGQELELYVNKIEKALDLASGPSDLVIILQRPASNHIYSVSFEKFVQDCPTLKAVDELIRFATNGARSIHTVTVLDALIFKPNWRKSLPNEKCHQLLAEVLRLKKPSVILQCHTEYYEDPWLQNHCLLRENYRLCWKAFTHDDETKTTVTQSFHPSAAVNYKRRRRPEYRILLLCHFAKAFSRLPGGTSFKIPRSIRSKCASNWYEVNSTDLAETYWKISDALDPKVSSETGYQGYSWTFLASPSYKQAIRDRNWCDSMYEQLVHLSEFSQPLGVFKISRAI